MRKPLIAGNWKMNGSKARTSELLIPICTEASSLSKIEMAVFPPFVYLPLAQTLLADSTVALGAQNVSSYDNGAYTGEISVEMLNDYGCKYVILGHSERRRLFGDHLSVVAAKFNTVIQTQVKPILCVGETEEQHQQGLTWKVIQEQLEVVFELKDNLAGLKNLVIAYEPVWAIGTGKHATPKQAQEVHEAIRKRLEEFDLEFASKIRIIYGGSVTPDNVTELMSMPDIDGALIGGASLEAAKFLEIGRKCNNLY